MAEAALQIETKECEACGGMLSLDLFYSHPKGGRSVLCRGCTVEDNKLRRQDPQKHQEVLLARREARKVRKTQGVSEKVCTKCHTPKLLTAFREHRGLYGRSSWCLECERKYNENRLECHRGEINERRRKQWAANPLPEEAKAAAAERSRAWYAANKEHHKQMSLRWAAENRQTHNAVQARRRARKASVVNTLTSAEWLETLEVFNHACAYCLRRDFPLTMDHVIPISKGGPHTVDNVVPACKPCNSKKHNRPIFVMLGQM